MNMKIVTYEKIKGDGEERALSITVKWNNVEGEHMSI